MNILKSNSFDWKELRRSGRQVEHFFVDLRRREYGGLLYGTGVDTIGENLDLFCGIWLRFVYLSHG